MLREKKSHMDPKTQEELKSRFNTCQLIEFSPWEICQDAKCIDVIITTIQTSRPWVLEQCNKKHRRWNLIKSDQGNSTEDEDNEMNLLDI